MRQPSKRNLEKRDLNDHLHWEKDGPLLSFPPSSVQWQKASRQILLQGCEQCKKASSTCCCYIVGIAIKDFFSSSSLMRCKKNLVLMASLIIFYFFDYRSDMSASFISFFRPLNAASRHLALVLGSLLGKKVAIFVAVRATLCKLGKILQRLLAARVEFRERIRFINFRMEAPPLCPLKN